MARKLDRLRKGQYLYEGYLIEQWAPYEWFIVGHEKLGLFRNVHEAAKKVNELMTSGGCA